MRKKILIGGDHAPQAWRRSQIAQRAQPAKGDRAEAPMFKKILIANRGDHAAGVAAQPDCPAGAAR